MRMLDRRPTRGGGSLSFPSLSKGARPPNSYTIKLRPSFSKIIGAGEG